MGSHITEFFSLSRVLALLCCLSLPISNLFFVTYGAHSIISENVRFAFLQCVLVGFFFLSAYAIHIHNTHAYTDTRTVTQAQAQAHTWTTPKTHHRTDTDSPICWKWVVKAYVYSSICTTLLDVQSRTEQRAGAGLDTKAEVLFDRCPLNRIYNSVYMHLCVYLFSIFFGDVKLNDVA